MDFLIQFIVKYWLEVLFGLITGGVVLFARHYIKVEKERYENMKKERAREIEVNVEQKLEKPIKDLTDVIEEVKETQIENDAVLKEGVLFLMKAKFVRDCEKLIEADHHITSEEWHRIEKEHIMYNKLGGNHEGDIKFNIVTEKWKEQVVHGENK